MKQFFIHHKRKFLILIVCVVGLAATSFGVLKYVEAQLGLLPFGGIVTSYRTCSGNDVLLIRVSGPMGGEFVYVPGSQAYESYNLGGGTGMWVLGMYSPGYPCINGNGDNIGGVGLITPTVGTSPAF